MNDSPFVVLINFEDKGIIVFLSFFDLKKFESLQQKSNEEDWSYNWNHKEDVREEQCNFSDWCRVVFVLDLHHWEEGEIKVNEHKESQICIEFELA